MRTFQNITLILGLLMLAVGAWLRRNQDTHARGSKLFWWGFALILVGLILDFTVTQQFTSGFWEGWNGRP